MKIVDRFDGSLLVTIATSTEIVPFWMHGLSVECPAPPPSDFIKNLLAPPPKPSLPNGFEMTADGFVWRGGQRLGWLDAAVSTFFHPDQVITTEATPTAKRGEKGRKIRSVLDWAAIVAQSGLGAPLGFQIEKTKDGYVWVDGQRIGWADPKQPLYFRVDQLDLQSDAPRPKRGQAGFSIINDESGALTAAPLCRYFHSDGYAIGRCRPPI